MTDRVARRLALTTALLLALNTPVGEVAAHGPDPVLSGDAFAQNQALTFRWRAGAEPSAAIGTAIKAAAADVTTTRASKAATFSYAAAGTNLIGYGSGATCGVNGLACFTRSAPTGFTMWLREQGHVFDWGTLKWCQAYTVAPNGCYDAETIALDEFGHVELLDHHVNYTDGTDYEDAVVQTFSRTKPKAGWDTHGFGECDVATLQREYDMASWTAKYSTCALLLTSLSVLAPATLTFGGTAIVTATLKVTDLAAYERLGANPISGRAVVLQTRTLGTTTWSTAGTMTAGATSGTYTRALKLTLDAQVRAVFKAPTDEGLDASTSTAATIAVGGCRIAPCPLSAGSR